jgi:excisionase family DNA binding protein
LERIQANNIETQKKLEEPIEAIKKKEFLTVRDASRLLNSSRQTIYNLIEKGTIKAVNLSQRKTLIKRDEIDSLFNQVVIPMKPETDTPPTYDIADCLTIPEIMERYNVSKSTLRSLTQRHNIPKVLKNRTVYLPLALVDEIFNPLKNE